MRMITIFKAHGAPDSNQEKSQRLGLTSSLARIYHPRSRQSPQEIAETAKEDAKQTQKSHQKLENLVDKSEKILMKAKAVFPFDLFPDQITVDTNKVNILKKTFFLTERQHSVSIKAITEVYVQTAPFFASLHIVDSALRMENKVSVKYLWKKDAEKARRFIQGLIDASKQDVDLSNLDVEEIRDKLEQMGQINTPEKSV